MIHHYGYVWFPKILRKKIERKNTKNEKGKENL